MSVRHRRGAERTRPALSVHRAVPTYTLDRPYTSPNRELPVCAGARPTANATRAAANCSRTLCAEENTLLDIRLVIELLEHELSDISP
jgi:hypothetical protein